MRSGATPVASWIWPTVVSLTAGDATEHHDGIRVQSLQLGAHTGPSDACAVSSSGAPFQPRGGRAGERIGKRLTNSR